LVGDEGFWRRTKHEGGALVHSSQAEEYPKRLAWNKQTERKGKSAIAGQPHLFSQTLKPNETTKISVKTGSAVTFVLALPVQRELKGE